MQDYTFSNRYAPSGPNLEAVCMCLCINMLPHVHFPSAKPFPQLKEEGQIYQLSTLQSSICFSSIHPRNRVHPRVVISQAFVTLFPILTSD